MESVRRKLQDRIEEWLFRGKVIILYGARQVGKTTLSKQILRKYGRADDYFNCEILSVMQQLERLDPLEMKQILGNTKLVVFDEAQHIPGIGRILKLLHDTYPEIQIIATGSSSFSLSAGISEPLTGRALEFVLYPFSYDEFSQVYTVSERPQLLQFNLRFGFYPDLAGKSEEDARFLLDNLTGKYLFRDILAFETLKKPSLLVKLLQMIAFQLGSEVSMNELAVNLGVTRKTIEHYLDLLEKSFVIFRLGAFSRNLRQEINKKVKIYFCDIGVRNSIIAAFNPLELRNDQGALWENFCLTERIKYLQSVKRYPRQYFWRTHQQQKIDYLEEENGIISAFKFKLSESPARMPLSFQKAYPESTFHVIHRHNFLSFIQPGLFIRNEMN